MTDTHLKNQAVPVIGFVGFSGSGKTTLLRQIIRKCRDSGLRAAVIKHAHHNFDIDTPGKDSYELRHAGAVQTIVASKHRWALMVETPDAVREPYLEELINQLDLNKLDVIFVEGFKHAAFLKMEIHRPELNKPLLYPDDPDIIALVTNQPSTVANSGKIPLLDLNDPKQIIQFLVSILKIKIKMKIKVE